VTNILIKGLYRTGSHALVDLLSEYDNVGVLPFEFDHYRSPANIADQLSAKSSRDWPNLIEASLKNNSLKWQVFEKVVPDQVVKMPLACNLLTRIPATSAATKKRYYNITLKKLNQFLKSDITFEEKIDRTKNWISEIGSIYARRKDYLVFDQPILPYTNIEVWPQVFDPFKLIFSIRNPKDQFADLVRSGRLFQPFGAPLQTWAGGLLEIIYGRDRAGALAIFKDAVLRLYEDLSFIRRNIDPENLLIVQFEKLVKDYNYQTAKIEDFIGGIDKHHASPKSQFNPERSIQNIGICEKYLTDTEMKGLADVEAAFRESLRA